MNLSVYRAVAIPKSEEFPERQTMLPVDFPFLVDDDSLEVHAPALDYLCYKFLDNGKYRSLHTVDAEAYDLCKFLRFDSNTELPIWSITAEDIKDYRNVLECEISPQTSDLLSDKTVFRLVACAIHYCEWGQSVGIVDPHTVLDRKVIRGRCRSPEEMQLIHTLSSEQMQPNAISDLLPTVARDSGDHVRALEMRDWQLVAAELGPLPLVSGELDPLQELDCRPCRDRLASHCSLETGLRVDEVANLTKYQILDLRVPEDAPGHHTIRMRITHTKGLHPRYIDMPADLVRALHIYIDGERRQCVEQGKRVRPGWKEEPTLFVNHVNAGKHAGLPIKPDTLSHAFRKAVLRAGLTRTVKKLKQLDLDRQEVFYIQDAAHRYHDLRHTFAIWTYLTEKEAGNAEPWKIVQARLGHLSLQTTLAYYLAHVREDRRATNAAVFREVRRMHGGN
ncbi:Tyrosine recombinase XerC [Paraburkholderia nemoris]|uniref:tyrosine-type recombinase/integrase n=1 Tax=Paraburkholderia nemoris TaxID=2793076 RepID=UPI0019141501|nr:site-specific integrase [Paraburkholderia nemoris]MBK5152478.1 site-specific integrase [Burkholderia sp. R-69608]CAE6967473.1 Tyrosine recombinase XerC [Paraburkholderia nemoris]